uniref:Uncharacterized protein n=1 Tax=Cacopsylla melanoneura TaxID=428564 RepID=A0A8D8RTK7_9HEMI
MVNGLCNDQCIPFRCFFLNLFNNDQFNRFWKTFKMPLEMPSNDLNPQSNIASRPLSSIGFLLSSSRGTIGHIASRPFPSIVGRYFNNTFREVQSNIAHRPLP